MNVVAPMQGSSVNSETRETTIDMYTVHVRILRRHSLAPMLFVLLTQGLFLLPTFYLVVCMRGMSLFEKNRIVWAVMMKTFQNCFCQIRSLTTKILRYFSKREVSTRLYYIRSKYYHILEYSHVTRIVECLVN